MQHTFRFLRPCVQSLSRLAPLTAFVATACSNAPMQASQPMPVATMSGTQAPLAAAASGAPAAIGGGGTASPAAGTSALATPSAGGPSSAAAPSRNTAGAAGSGAAGIGTNGTGSSAAAGSGSAVPTGPASFTRVWTEVLSLKGCAGAYCHGGGQGNLKFTNKADAYKALVGVMAAGSACGSSSKLRVKAGDATASLLLEKMEQTKPSCGDPMPIGTKLEPNCLSMNQSVCNTQAELSLVKQWITAGAKDD